MRAATFPAGSFPRTLRGQIVSSGPAEWMLKVEATRGVVGRSAEIHHANISAAIECLDAIVCPLEEAKGGASRSASAALCEARHATLLADMLRASLALWKPSKTLARNDALSVLERALRAANDSDTFLAVGDGSAKMHQRYWTMARMPEPVKKYWRAHKNQDYLVGRKALAARTTRASAVRTAAVHAEQAAAAGGGPVAAVTTVAVSPAPRRRSSGRRAKPSSKMVEASESAAVAAVQLQLEEQEATDAKAQAKVGRAVPPARRGRRVSARASANAAKSKAQKAAAAAAAAKTKAEGAAKVKVNAKQRSIPALFKRLVKVHAERAAESARLKFGGDCRPGGGLGPLSYSGLLSLTVDAAASAALVPPKRGRPSAAATAAAAKAAAAAAATASALAVSGSGRGGGGPSPALSVDAFDLTAMADRGWLAPRAARGTAAERMISQRRRAGLPIEIITTVRGVHFSAALYRRAVRIVEAPSKKSAGKFAAVSFADLAPTPASERAAAVRASRLPANFMRTFSLRSHFDSLP